MGESLGNGFNATLLANAAKTTAKGLGDAFSLTLTNAAEAVTNGLG